MPPAAHLAGRASTQVSLVNYLNLSYYVLTMWADYNKFAMLLYKKQPRLIFFWTLFITLVLKLFLAITFPLTGDEAFFYQWGRAPALGYADHPPMVGWWLAALGALSDQLWVGRLPAVLLTFVIAWGIVDVLQRLLPQQHHQTAWWIGSIYLVMPWSWMLVLITTDTPLIFFITLSAWFFIRAERTDAPGRIWHWYAISGFALGLAFLSKYFAVLMGFAYVLYIVGWRRDRWWGLCWIVACAIPLVILHLYFNANHGWTNIMFNFFNRHDSVAWGYKNVLLYAVMMLYLLTPWILYQSVQSVSLSARKARTTILILLISPLVVLLVVSFKRPIGLHWVLGFVPLFMVWAGMARYSADQLSKFFKWTIYLSLPHLFGVWYLVGSPLAWWEESKQFDRLVFLRYANQVTLELTSNLPISTHLMADSYSPAAVLSYHYKQRVPVFGVGTFSARQDDLVANFAELDGRNMRIFYRSPVDMADVQPYFESIKVKEFNVAGVVFYGLDGAGFRYEKYRQNVLTEIADRFHDVPTWLPMWGNPFCERYGFAECAPGSKVDANVRQ